MFILPISIQLRRIHLHCHLCAAVAHLSLPPESDDLEVFVAEPANRWIGSHRDPHLFAVDLVVNGRAVTRPVGG